MVTTIATIQISEVFTKVQQLSSFEGRNAVTPSGESDYGRVRITEQDRPWIESMAEEGANQLITKLLPLADTCSVNDDAISISSTMTDSKRTNTGLAQTICAEALYAYVMRQWCSEHKPERRDFYNQLFDESCHSVAIVLRSKRKPALSDIE